MQLRRSFALVTGALLLAVPALSSCGFDYATDKINTIGPGVNYRGGEVDVLSAVIVAAQEGSGTFIATMSNNSETASVTFDSLEGGDDTAITADDFEPLEIAPLGYANLAEEGGVKLTGSFTAGQFVPVTVGFEDGDSVAMEVPVVTACHNYEGLDPSASASTSATPTVDPTAVPSAAPTDGLTTAPAESSDEPSDEAASEDPSATPSEYSCEYAEIPTDDPAVAGDTGADTGEE